MEREQVGRDENNSPVDAFIEIQIVNSRNKPLKKDTPLKLNKNYNLRVWMRRLPLQTDDRSLPLLKESEVWDGEDVWAWVFSPDNVVFDNTQKDLTLSKLSVLREEGRVGDFFDFSFVVHDVIQKRNNDKLLRGRFVNLMIDVGHDRSLMNSFRITSRVRK